MQERSEFLDNMGAKRIRKMKVGQASVKTAAAASEGNQKLLTRNEGRQRKTTQTKYCYPLGGMLGRIRMEGTRVVTTAAGSAEALAFDLRTA